MIGSTEGRKKIAMGFRQAKECKGTVMSGDVFEAEALGWYLKPRSEEVDASGCAKGNRN